jgi:hypothetical protein
MKKLLLAAGMLAGVSPAFAKTYAFDSAVQTCATRVARQISRGHTATSELISTLRSK